MMLQSKIDIGESIFSQITRLAREHNAINLGQGFPDFDMDHRLIELVGKAMQDGYNQYTPTSGVASLRQAIAEKIHFLYHRHIDPDTEICITPGATYAIFTALATVLRRNDEVLIFDPAYDSYRPAVEMNGARAVSIPLAPPHFRIDWERVRKAITARTKLILINTPHNPSGMIMSDRDMLELRNLVVKHDLLVLSDEVYEHIVFDDQRFESVLKYPELYQRSLVTYSFGKVFHCTGWKTGYCVAPPPLMQEFIKVHQFNAFSSFGPVQHALAEYITDRRTYQELGALLQPRRDLLAALLSDTGLKPLPSHGSFFQLYDYSSLSDLDEYSFAKKLTIEARVAAIPVSPFYADKRNQQLLRFCFVKKEETLQRAGERLSKYLPGLKQRP